MPMLQEDNAGVDGPFTIITKKGGEQFVYMEVQGRSNLPIDREETQRAAARYAIIRAQALNPQKEPALHRDLAGRAMKNLSAWVASRELAWFKSRYSGAEGGQCVDVASGTAAVHVRDSKDVTGPVLTVSPQVWVDFVRSAG